MKINDTSIKSSHPLCIELHRDLTRKRLRVANAVHRAVCKFTNSDGVGWCKLYALAGARLATQVFDADYSVKIGGLNVKCDPKSDGGWGYVPSRFIDPYQAGEFHCWFSCGDEVVDLSTRHLKKHYDLCAGGEPYWVIGPPPKFVWGRLPNWLALTPDHALMRMVGENILTHPGHVSKLNSLAWKEWLSEADADVKELKSEEVSA